MNQVNNNPCLSVIIPARNEQGTIQPLIEGLTAWVQCPLEVIIIESGSTDETWKEIQKNISSYSHCLNIKGFKIQTLGKQAAVHYGLDQSTAPVAIILDADLTVGTEELAAFYSAYLNGKGQFINGSRFLIPMEAGAMPLLNKLGNRFFAWLLGKTTGVKLSDTLCGTKLFQISDYKRFRDWSQRHLLNDPFGDFELLLPAAFLGVSIYEVPVNYKRRIYGKTNIHRFTDGLKLLKIIGVGLAYRFKKSSKS